MVPVNTQAQNKAFPLSVWRGSGVTLTLPQEQGMLVKPLRKVVYSHTKGQV